VSVLERLGLADESSAQASDVANLDDVRSSLGSARKESDAQLSNLEPAAWTRHRRRVEEARLRSQIENLSDEDAERLLAEKVRYLLLFSSAP